MTLAPQKKREDAANPRFALVMLFVGVLNLSMAFADEVVQRGVPFILGIGCMASAIYNPSSVRAVVVIGVVVLALYVIRATSRR